MSGQETGCSPFKVLNAAQLWGDVGKHEIHVLLSNFLFSLSPLSPPSGYGPREINGLYKFSQKTGMFLEPAPCKSCLMAGLLLKTRAEMTTGRRWRRKDMVMGQNINVVIQGATVFYSCELLSSYGETDERGSTSLTNQPDMMRTSFELKYLLYITLRQSCFLLLVPLGE